MHLAAFFLTRLQWRLHIRCNVHAPSYRSARIRQLPEKPASPRIRDADLIAPFAVLWVASFVLVLQSVFRHETLGAEPTLALLAVLVLPYLLLGRRV